MVCSPHRYIVAGVASGIRYESGNSLTYATPAYSDLSAKRYEQQRLTDTNYNTQTKTETQEITAKNNWYRYDTPQNNDQLFTETTTTSPPITYVPLRPSIQFHPEEPRKEAPMTNQNLRQTKQKLAQLIMNELDALGPREEHAHEHGEHTHVH